MFLFGNSIRSALRQVVTVCFISTCRQTEMFTFFGEADSRYQILVIVATFQCFKIYF